MWGNKNPGFPGLHSILYVDKDDVVYGSFSAPEAEFLDVTWTKFLRVFLELAIHNHLYSQILLEQKWFETGM